MTWKQLEALINDDYYCRRKTGEGDDFYKKYKKYVKRELTYEEIVSIARECKPDYIDNLADSYPDDTLAFFKCEVTYHLTIDDLLYVLRNQLNNNEVPNLELLDKWVHELHAPHFTPDIEELIKDFKLEGEDAAIAIGAELISSYLDITQPAKEIERVIKFLEESKQMIDTPLIKRSYSKDVLKLVAHYIVDRVEDDHIEDEELLDFAIKNKIIFANEGDYDMMFHLGYNYYEGTGGMTQDYGEATYWLEKCYSVYQDPNIARTLGYIYYYGRNTDGVPEKEKAFQYFAIGHIAGENTEATYKLADCYEHGYGTPINYQAACNLCGSIFHREKEALLSCHFNKYADVALRLGKYFMNGMFFDKDLSFAYELYLSARTAIRLRLLMDDEYIGDRQVAAGINESIKKLETELHIPDREIKLNHYVINIVKEQEYDNVKIGLHLCKNGYLNVSFASENEDYFLPTFTSIGFSEIGLILNFKFKVNLYEEQKELLKKNYDHLVIGPDTIELCNDDDYLEIPYTEALYKPADFKELGKTTRIASVEFYPGGKTYDYLLLKDAKVGDIVSIFTDNNKKDVKIVDIKYIYYDQLPLPYEKMGKIK